MKKQVFIIACVLGILCALVLPAFAVDTSHIYEYYLEFDPENDGPNEYRSRFPASFVSASDCYSHDVLLWAKNDTVAFTGFDDFYVYYTINGHGVDEGGNYTLEGDNFPLVFHSYSGTLTTVGGNTLTGLDVTPPETTAVPTAFGSSVNDGFSNSIGFAGEVLDFIVDSPILICVGVAVGVALLAWGISKVKDLVKGY